MNAVLHIFTHVWTTPLVQFTILDLGNLFLQLVILCTIINVIEDGI